MRGALLHYYIAILIYCNNTRRGSLYIYATMLCNAARPRQSAPWISCSRSDTPSPAEPGDAEPDPDPADEPQKT